MFNNIDHTMINHDEVPVTDLHRATEDFPAGTSFWVIQSTYSDEPRYWSGYFFTSDLKEACRFCRKEDAEKACQFFSKMKGFKSMRHQWL